MKRTVLRCLLAAGLVAASAVAAPPGASAYPQEVDVCYPFGRTSMTYWFDSTWNSYTTAKGWARDAIEEWDTAIDYDGAKLMPLSEVSSGGDIQISVLNIDGPAEMHCPGLDDQDRRIILDPSIMTDQEFVWMASRHEMGHHLGLFHTGDDASGSTDVATMSTCSESALPSNNALTKDDYAYMMYVHSDAGYYQMQANYGFEQGLDYWGYSGGVLEHQTTGGAGGPQRLRHKTVTSASYVHQYFNFAVGNDNEEYRSVAQYKVDASNYTGHLTATLYRKQLDYYALDPNEVYCGWADGLSSLNQYDEISTSYVAMVSTDQSTVTGKTSWYKVESDWVDPANADGYRFDYRVHSHADDSVGTNQWVYLDNLRSEGTCVGDTTCL